MGINKLDIIFYCNVTNSSGFGHGFRCAKLAKILNQYDNKLSIGIKGKVSYSAKYLMLKEYRNLIFLHTADKINSKTSFIDMMFDIEDPNFYDIDYINKIERTSNKTIFLSSGIELPKLNNNITIIGYQPNLKNYNADNIFWNIKYAPTYIYKKNIKEVRDENSIFLALGGFKNNIELDIIIEAINKLKYINKVNILHSPVNSDLKINYKNIRSDLELILHKNVESIVSFLTKSTLVIASYGNLCFEALSYNASLGIIGQKSFQIEYANLLEKKKIALSIGLPSQLGVINVMKSINNLYSNRKFYYKNSSKSIPKNGLKNIADIIIKEF